MQPHGRAVVTLRPLPPGDDGALRMSPLLLEQLGLKPGSRVVLWAGRRRLPVRVDLLWPRPCADPHPDRHGDPSRSFVVRVSPELMHRAALPRGVPLMMMRSGGDVHVGPFVGIYCQRYPGPSLYGPQTAFFRRLIRLGRTMNMCVYVFEARDVDTARGVIHGVTWEEGRGWVRRRFPLPHVLYDRGMVNGRVMRIQNWLRRRGVQQFNAWVGSKWWVYRQMAKVPELARYIPETVVLRRTADLAAMLRRHGTVYVKAAGGGKGIGIWLITADGRGGCVYRYTDARCRIHGGRTRDLSGIVGMLLSRPRRPWLIQPKIDLLRHRGRIFDVRVLVQRDGEGVLRVTGTGARVGRRGSFVSNIYGGGDARRLEPLLQEELGLDADQAAAMRREIEGVALAVAELLHRACRRTGHVGELGVDIGIDRRGRLWFFEANSRTGRNVFQMAGMRESARNALRRPLEFAFYLSGFSGSFSTAAETLPYEQRSSSAGGP